MKMKGEKGWTRCGSCGANSHAPVLLWYVNRQHYNTSTIQFAGSSVDVKRPWRAPPPLVS